MDGKEMPVVYLLGEQYIKAMNDMAQSDNAKTVVLPADILNTVKGLVGDKLKGWFYNHLTSKRTNLKGAWYAPCHTTKIKSGDNDRFFTDKVLKDR